MARSRAREMPSLMLGGVSDGLGILLETGCRLAVAPGELTGNPSNLVPARLRHQDFGMFAQ